MKSAMKNWKGLALGAAAVGIGVYLMRNWRSKRTDPIGNDPGEHASNSLFGGTGANMMAPPTMQGENMPTRNVPTATPRSYTARITDPSSTHTNIRIRGYSKNSMNYASLGNAMGEISAGALGVGSSRVNTRVTDDRKRTSDRGIRRQIARMA